MKGWKIAAYRLWQWTWGLPQTLAGLAVALKYRHCPRKRVGGAVATLHDGNWGGVSLGMFIFVPQGLRSEREAALLAHEYGHTFQSALLGPRGRALLPVGEPAPEPARTGRKTHPLRVPLPGELGGGSGPPTLP